MFNSLFRSMMINTTNKYLQNAWYNKKHAEILLKHNLDPSLKQLANMNDEQISLLKYESPNIDNYINILSIECKNSLKTWYNNDNINFKDVELWVKNTFGYYGEILKPEIINSAFKLKNIYEENLDHDRKFPLSPSKNICNFYLWTCFSNPNNKKKFGEGYWILRFDKINEYKNNLTQLDIAFRKISFLKHFKYNIKCSTLRPTKLYQHKYFGYIYVFSSFKDKQEVLNEIKKLIPINNYPLWVYKSYNLISKY